MDAGSGQSGVGSVPVHVGTHVLVTWEDLRPHGRELVLAGLLYVPGN